jgi:hypothetical protein
MIYKIAKNLILLFFLLLCCVNPVNAAAINTIRQGNVIFLGEEGLDISLAMGVDTEIGWWASAADITSSSPTKTIDLNTRMRNFMASPVEFSDYPGNWYRLNSAEKADGIAFKVIEPQLDIKPEDTTVQVDVETLKWIPTGDDIRFRIDTNLDQMLSQRSAPALITIKVQAPDGGSYTSLYNAGGTPVSIVDIPVTTRPFYTDSIWNMANRDRYPPGTYTIWAECNVNKMNDNYGATGKTMSRKFTLLNQGVNPLITKPTTESAQTTNTPTQTTLQATASLPTQTLTGTTVPISTPSLPPTTFVLSPSPGQTKAPGFEVILSVAAIFLGLVFYLKKE